jgi:hypothetical protein
MTLDEFREIQKGLIYRTWATVVRKPDGDWGPQAVIEGSNGASHVILLRMHKDLWPRTLIRAIERFKAVKIATIYSSWMLYQPNEAELARVNAGESMQYMPKRVEAIVLMCLDREGALMSTCRIVRDPKKAPVLSEWEDFEEREGTELKGAQIEPLAAAMKGVAHDDAQARRD